MHKHALFVCASLLVVVLAAGCGGGDSSSVPPPPEGAAPGAPAAGGGGFDMSKANATITGKISFEGTPPANEKAQMSSDPFCAKNAGSYQQLETVQVSDGGLKNVIVHVSSGLPAETFATTTTPVEIDQQNCHYIPHVFTMMVNQPLKIKNSDMTLHNIHAWAEKNTPINVAQPVAGMVTDAKFTTEETIPIRCDVHKWMGAFVGVFNHPFHTVSKDGGTFELKVPPGKYEITAWHERFGKKTMMVEVPDGGKAEANVSFSASDKAD
jgi:hypothetical protein